MWKPERAKQLIEEKGLTRKWLAQQIGIEVGSLTQILCGNRNPSRPVLKLMAQHLNTTAEDLAPESTPEAG